MKPLNKKAYGSIPHLPGSRLGESDSHIHVGQAKILTRQVRDRLDTIIVTEKLDGSNCSIAKISGTIYPLTRAGYIAETSPFEQHHYFQKWVENNTRLFNDVLKNGEWISGEWMIQAHGTRYNIEYPFYVFDLFSNRERVTYAELIDRIKGKLPTPERMWFYTGATSIEEVNEWLGEKGHHGAIDSAEGAVWRCERKGKVDFLAKYVRPEKVDGVYMKKEPPIWNYDVANLQTKL
jgi:hypothetical protein